MRCGLILAFLIATPCWSQTATTGQAETSGLCSPAVTGNSNTFTINCGIGKEQGAALLKIVNKILSNQLDTKAVMDKLDELEQVMKNSALRSRVLSPTKLQAFTDALRNAPGGILRIIPAGTGEDIFPLEKQLCGAAQEKRWATACPTSRNAEWGDADVEGFECYATDWTAKDAVAFKEAMKAADLSCKYFPNGYDFHGFVPLATGTVQNGVTILIGRHPQS
jgi:hypothetical protein